MKSTVLSVLTCLLIWIPNAPVWSAETIIIERPATTEFAFLNAAPQVAQAIPTAPPPPEDPPTESDLWLNSTYALGGAAAGNASAVLVFGLIDILPLLLTQVGWIEGSPNWVEGAGPWLLLLLLLPMAGTPLLMHLNSPEARVESVGWSIAGSVISTLLHALLMIPLVFVFGQGKLSDTVYLLAPAAVITALILESLGTAGAHQLGETWRLTPTSDTGLQLTRHWSF